VHQRDGADAVGILQVVVKLPQLAHQQHAFIYDGPAGKGRNICVDVGLLEHPAGDVQFSVEGQPPGAVLRPLNKALAYHRHALSGPLAQHLRVGWHVAPAQKFHALLGHNYLHHLFGLSPAQVVPGEEEHAYAVVPLFAQLYFILRDSLFH